MKFRTGLVLSLLPFFAQAQTSKPYFQQRVDTRMTVTLDDQKHELTATADYDYTNNSPDTLRSIFWHLYPNAYKSDQTAFNYQQIENGKTDFYFSKKKDKGGFQELSFGDAGTLRYYKDDSIRNIDQGELVLQTPLLPGEKRRFSAHFRVKIPKVFSRFGHTDQAYFITQWFPKPSVYDRQGWHVMPYLDQGEFFSEIGSYDVEITVPENYVVMATGNLQTPRENQWLDSLSRVPYSAYKNARDTFPKSSPITKTIRFTEDNVHDFAWFADKRFIVRKDTASVCCIERETKVQSESKRNDGQWVNKEETFPETVPNLVTLYSAFLPSDSNYWKRGNDYLKAALKVYSENLGPYPYRTIKAVEGDMKAGGGMEYPTITVIDRDASVALKTVVIHEAGHNWFQGILASNERRYPWQDEGLNSFYEQKTVQAYNEAVRDSVAKAKGIPRSKNDLRQESTETIFYYELAKTGQDQPLNLPSEDYRYANYGGDVYYKTAAWMRWLEGYMGKENLRAAMQDYYETWKFRHPHPEDLFAIWKKHSPKNIDWFIDNAFTTTEPVDFSLRKAGSASDSVQIAVKNRLSFPAPAGVVGMKGDSIAAQVWTAPFEGQTTVSLPRLDYERIVLSGAIPDATSSNNSTTRGFKLGIAGGFQYGYKTKAWLAPALGYNVYDGIQAGLLIHNIFGIPQSRFRYALAPTYAFRSKALTGAGSVGYFWFLRGGAFQSVGLQADFKSYHYDESGLNVPNLLMARYYKLAPELSFVFRNADPRSPVTRSLSARAYGIREEGFSYALNPADSLYRPSLTHEDLMYGRLRYEHRNDRTLHPFRYAVELHGNGDFGKLMAEGNLRIDYHRKNQGLEIRAFAGKVWSYSDKPLPLRNALHASYTAADDYLYDGVYFGRSERDGFSSHQLAIREGGLKIPTPYYANPLGVSDNWLAAVNVSTSIPYLPVRLFFDAATFSNAAQNSTSGAKILYDGGVSVHLPYDVLSVYWPFIFSPDYRDYLNSVEGKSGIKQTIRFQLNLQNVNWLRFTSKALKKMM